MEDSNVNSVIDNVIKQQCYFCTLGDGSISIYVPFGFLEQFVTVCTRSGVSVSIVSTQKDIIL